MAGRLKLLVSRVWHGFLCSGFTMGWAPTHERRSGAAMATPVPSAKKLRFAYLAGTFESKLRLRKVRAKLRTLGYKVSSSWLDEKSAPTQISFDTLSAMTRRSYAERDLKELEEVDVLFLDTLGVNTRGGREVELGVALEMGLPVVRLGPSRNVFHEFADYAFPSWRAFFKAAGEEQ